jgi:hypothetical protein
LSLTAEDYRDLRRQGTVCSEDRRGKVYFKLRFRKEDGRQRVRYLGGDRAVAESIRRELQELQLHRQHQSDLRQHDMEARKLLRQVKQNLVEAIAAHGFHFHGFSIRRRSRLGRGEGSSSQITD